MQRVILICRCQEGKGATLLDFLRAELPATRAFEGCQSVETFVDADDPDTVILFEQWAAREDNELYLAWRYETKMMDAINPLLQAPPELHYLDLDPA